MIPLLIILLSYLNDSNHFMVMVMFVVEEEEELTSRALLTFNTQPGVIGLFSSIICGQALEHGRILGGKFLNVQ